MKSVRVFFAPGQPVLHVHDDTIAAISARLGPQTIRRASHVDVWADLSDAAKSRFVQDHPGAGPASADRPGFFVDMLPSQGPVLGPFDRRDTALAAEVAQLEELFRARHSQGV